MDSFIINLSHQEDEIFQRLHQIIQKLEVKDLTIERSPQIASWYPDFVIKGTNGFLVVIEVKFSLTKQNTITKAYNMVKHSMELINAPYGYVTNGQKAFYLETDSSQYRIVEPFYNHIESLLKKYKLKTDEIVSVKQLISIKQLLNSTYKEFEDEKKIDIPDIKTFIYNLTLNDCIQSDGNISFTEDKERQFIGWLLGHYHNDSLCRYTSMAGLFRTIESQKHSMVCLIGMNDKGETDYVKNYTARNGHNNLYSTSINKLNNLFILSCCNEQKEDNLTMFRLYGDDSRGVCLKYGIKDLVNFKEFFIAPVSYANPDGRHPKLDFLIDVSKIVTFRHLDAWLHFFKSYDYQVEEEVRVIYELKGKIRNKKWINISSYGIICPVVEFDSKDFPLSLDMILLGPNCPEKEINKSQIETMAIDKSINLKYGVDISKKDCYRVSI